jgi:hypothetical protein
MLPIDLLGKALAAGIENVVEHGYEFVSVQALHRSAL